MDTSTVLDVAHFPRAFALSAELAGVERFGAGHINDPFRVTVGGGQQAGQHQGIRDADDPEEAVPIGQKPHHQARQSLHPEEHRGEQTELRIGHRDRRG